MKFFAKVDKVLLGSTFVLLIGGLLVFSSAALGVLSSNENKFYAVLENQLVFALLGGVVALFLGTLISFKLYEKYAVHIFIVALAFTSLVFVPFLAVYHGGSQRWIDVGGFTLQPSEFLKFALVIIVSALCAKYAPFFRDYRFGILPYLAVILPVSIIMLLQPDFGTYLIMMSASFIVYYVGGAKMKHILFFIIAGILGFIALLYMRPYMMERVTTFFDKTHDVRGSSWQVNQSLIAIGSGGVFGRGYGQSVQKFNFLPEPIGDSIFAVLAEEIGLIGVITLFFLYGIVIFRGLKIALNSASQFGRLLAIGIVTVIFTQVALNIGSMVGIIPLTGVPLPLVSHGGTALMAILFQIGVILNISKQTNYL